LETLRCRPPWSVCSGLGLEAQRKAVADYLKGGAWDLVGEFTEVESGKKSDRPELRTTIEACRRHKARLVIAKLDRLKSSFCRVHIPGSAARVVDLVNILDSLSYLRSMQRPGEHHGRVR
jgi:DNA invertase Pin-like site-specific DNA recombinase